MYTLSRLHHISSFLMYIFTLYEGFLIKIPLLSKKIPISDFDPGAVKFLTMWNVISLKAIFDRKNLRAFRLRRRASTALYLCLLMNLYVCIFVYSSVVSTLQIVGAVDTISAVCTCDREKPCNHEKLFEYLKNTIIIRYRSTDQTTLIHRHYINGNLTMRDGLLIGFHVISCVQFAFSVYYDYMYTIVPPNVLKVHNGYGGKFKFLTFWDAIIQAIFFFICILNDWFGTNAVSPKKPPFIRKLKDHIHSILGFPIAMFVGIIFWALMFVDRELVFPKALDSYFPWWLNHLMHTMIMVSTFIEMILSPRKYPSRSVHIIFYKSGIWVYPVLEVLSLPLRIVFFTVLLSITLILYMIGEAVDNFFWGNEYTKSQKSYAKSK
ncbi:unnamed protein product [Heterotrigona itama]|uniref:Uncharacterized protein n=1 Tax=Heterotrigona itama TaxID=395501 RepID=A0A6V7GZC6_9HYME|nr:unnamed protein product [Heterotrigona itama]